MVLLSTNCEVAHIFCMIEIKVSPVCLREISLGSVCYHSASKLSKSLSVEFVDLTYAVQRFSNEYLVGITLRPDQSVRMQFHYKETPN